MELLQLNKFGDLHNGQTIIFCKTEFLRKEFKKISKIKNEVVLISGNSDESIDAGLVAAMPGNIQLWYGQNAATRHPKLKCLPIGLENTSPNARSGHGIGWQHAVEKIALLKTLTNHPAKQIPVKLLYANFNVNTNRAHRLPVKELCIATPFINWDEPSLTYPEFIDHVLDHEAVLCPAGNGLDTHRLYEVLYCGRVAVTIKTGNHSIYADLYEKLPVVILNTSAELKDEAFLKQAIANAKQKPFENGLLDFNYWKQQVEDAAARIVKKPQTVMDKFIRYFS